MKIKKWEHGIIYKNVDYINANYAIKSMKEMMGYVTRMNEIIKLLAFEISNHTDKCPMDYKKDVNFS